MIGVDLVAALRTRASIRQRLRAENDRIAAVCTDAANRIEELESRCAGLESLRPVWAYGHTSEQISAQVTAAALAQIWAALGVTNQTEAMQKLEALK